MKIYSLRVFHEMGNSCYSYKSVRVAYRMANRAYRKLHTCVVLENLITGEILYSRCDNDYSVEQFLKYMDGRPNVFNKITRYKRV